MLGKKGYNKVISNNNIIMNSKLIEMALLKSVFSQFFPLISRFI